MADDTARIASGGVMRIDLLSDLDVAYWCRVLDVDHCELRRAVQRVGPSARAVVGYLDGLRAGAAEMRADKPARR